MSVTALPAQLPGHCVEGPGGSPRAERRLAAHDLRLPRAASPAGILVSPRSEPLSARLGRISEPPAASCSGEPCVKPRRSRATTASRSRRTPCTRVHPGTGGNPANRRLCSLRRASATAAERLSAGGRDRLVAFGRSSRETRATQRQAWPGSRSPRGRRRSPGAMAASDAPIFPRLEGLPGCGRSSNGRPEARYASPSRRLVGMQARHP